MPRYMEYDQKHEFQRIEGTDLVRMRTYTFTRFHCPDTQDPVTIFPAEPPPAPLGYSEWKYARATDWTPVEARRSEIRRQKPA